MNSISNPEADLIQQIYAAAYDPAKWVDVMERLSDAVGGLRGAAREHRRRQKGPTPTRHRSPEFFEDLS